MALLRDVGRVETCFGPPGLLILRKIGARLALSIPCAQKSFWTHEIILLGHMDQAEAHFNLFGDSFNPGAR
jgi:hypothetical protein